MRDIAATVLIMIVVGWSAAGTPFRGDQGLFTLVAERLDRGAVLYRDVWDLTNPGVFAFYWLGGRLFGYTEDGIHFFEWLWWLAFIIALERFLKYYDSANRSRTSSMMIPLVLGGWYYTTASADPSNLTKAEGLVAFPLVMAIVGACIGLKSQQTRWFFAAGIAGGIAVCFKLAFGLCLVAGLLPAVIISLRARRMNAIIMMMIGLLIPILTVMIYFDYHQISQLLYDTLFIIPRDIVAHAEPGDTTRLMMSVRWFVETSSSLAVLAVLGLIFTPDWKRDPFLAGLVLMLPAAVVVILIQTWSWWTYHFELVAVPVAVLAVATWPHVVARVGPLLHRKATAGLLVVLFMSPLLHGASAWLRLANHKLGLRAADRDAARTDAGAAYHVADSETAWLETMPPEPIFVAGDPLFHLRSGWPMATTLHGWSLELFTPALWHRLAMEIAAAPPKFIYISKVDAYDRLLTWKGVELQAILDAKYRLRNASRSGVWYERISDTGIGVP
jgi:hypothetical protein